MPERKSSPPLYYGGQAVIEGVMMRGPRNMAVAARAPDGAIVSRAEPLRGASRGRVRRVPLVRGLVLLYDTLSLGIRSLTWSSQVAAGKEPVESTRGQLLSSLALAGTFVTGFFFVLPVLLTGWLTLIGISAWVEVVAEGVLRVVMLVGYVWLIGRVPDVQRLFGYHAAEHRAIHAHERGEALTSEAVWRHPNEHVRCGTAFLLTTTLIALVLFIALGTPPVWARIVERIVLLPVIAGLAYEVLRLGQAFRDNRLFALAYSPNLWLQKLTTRDPDDGMVEVAIAALERVVALEALADQAEPRVRVVAEEPLS